MNQIWKKIDGCSNYLISNYGEVKSLPQKGNFFKKPTLLKQNLDKDGYKVVSLTDDNKKKRLIKVHRLVALAFLSNPNNLPCINHKNEIKTDNRVENLEWCTVVYNNCYGKRLEKLKNKGKEVIQKTLEGTTINTYKNVKQASEFTNVCRSSIICCCNKKPYFISAGGYKWEYSKGKY